jgi:hypothetical protein
MPRPEVYAFYSGEAAYPTEEQAILRVEALRKNGIWPGIKTDGIDFWLTFDPSLQGEGYA